MREERARKRQDKTLPPIKRSCDRAWSGDRKRKTLHGWYWWHGFFTDRSGKQSHRKGREGRKGRNTS